MTGMEEINISILGGLMGGIIVVTIVISLILYVLEDEI
tara:strand:- start:983 stop:1096 length:114 start_codon:yes stop_codon:yes gene_type:complete